MDDFLEDVSDIESQVAEIVEGDLTWYAVAERVLGDSLRVEELFDLNPSLIFEDPENFIGEVINVPSEEQILNFAKPQLTKVGAALSGAGDVIDQARSLITDVSGKLPPQFQGYTKEALKQLGKLNGIRENAEQAISEKTLSELLGKIGRGGTGTETTLIKWLLGKRG